MKIFNIAIAVSASSVSKVLIFNYYEVGVKAV
jgi:hypothetical protein